MSQPQPNLSSLMYQQHGATAVPTASLGPVLYTAGPVHTTTLRTVQSSPPYIPASTTSQPPPPFASPGFPLSSDQATFLQQQQQHHPVLEISQDYRNAFFSVNTAFSSQQMPAVAVPPSPSQQTASAFPSAPAAHTSQATVVGVATDAVATTVPFAGIRLYRPSADRPGPAPQPTTRMASSPPLHTRDKGYACQLYALHGNCPYRNCPFMHIKGGERRSLPHAVCIYYMQDRCLREECKYFHGNPTRLHRLHAMGEKDYCPLDNMPSFNPSVPPTEPDGEIPAAVRTGAVPPRETPPQVAAAPVVAVLPPQPPTAPAPYTGALAYSAAFQPTTSVPYSTPHSVMMTVQPQPVHSSHGVMWSTPGQYTPWAPPNNLPTLPFSPTPPPPPHPSSSSLTTHPQTTYVVLTPYDAWPLR